ncbi:TadA family conjugal transfer-associated ATPase [Microbacterium sp. 4R-513]|uniref:TadA family conjugal transfer-associated ATPase n=1 Tax=Microbacterium sp. 4R-513 TaxID=2567934 RepID=UPI0013E1FAB7|nr:TadA family conjugal transfer-associated ATPase [Microbacterium sp. 4R-513]QIG39955.1 TadA family conjugal transfer-associated ATPase [Microbacterium sp. 4R-513]
MPEPFVVSPRGASAPQAPSRAGATEIAAGIDPRGGADRFTVQPAQDARGDGGAVSAEGSGARHFPPALRSASLPPALDPLADILDDPEVTDLFVNGADGLFVDRGSGAQRSTSWRASEEDVRELAVALVGAGGRHLDDAAPCVDVRLEGGIRVHAVLPPISSSGTVISIRVPRLQTPTLDALGERGMFDAGVRERLDAAVAQRENLLVTGAAGAGKTTLLAALLGRAAPSDRIVTIEDVAELRLDHPHHVRLEARQPNLEGAGGIGLARLVREALRMRPDRLVVGECRGDEVRELLAALNTGHDGGAGTLHANGLHEVPARLEALGALALLDDRALARQVVSAIGIVLHVSRDRDGIRRLSAIGRPVLGSDGRLAMEEAT